MKIPGLETFITHRGFFLTKKNKRKRKENFMQQSAIDSGIRKNSIHQSHEELSECRTIGEIYATFARENNNRRLNV